MRLDESTVTTCLTRSRSKRLDIHDSTEKSNSNPLSVLLNSKTETPTLESEHDTDGSASY